MPLNDKKIGSSTGEWVALTSAAPDADEVDSDPDLATLCQRLRENRTSHCEIRFQDPARPTRGAA